MCSDHIILLMIISFLAMIYAKSLLHPSKKRFLLHRSLKASIQRNLKRSSKLVSATCTSSQRALPIIIWRARHGRRHPRSKGPGKEFIYFFLQEKWAAFLRLYIRPGNHRGCIGGGLQETHGNYYSCRCNGRKPIGSRSSLLPAASMFSFLSPHASAKASYTAFSFSSIARETTNPNSSPKHAYLPRLHQSHITEMHVLSLS